MSGCVQECVLGNDQGVRYQDDAVASALNVPAPAEITTKVGIVAKAHYASNEGLDFTNRTARTVSASEPVIVMRAERKTGHVSSYTQRLQAIERLQSGEKT